LWKWKIVYVHPVKCSINPATEDTYLLIQHNIHRETLTKRQRQCRKFFRNTQKRFLISLVSIYLLIHLSTDLSYHPSLLRSFTLGSKPTFQQILPTLDLFYLLHCLRDNGTGPDLLYAYQFIFSFTFLLLVCLFRVVA